MSKKLKDLEVNDFEVFQVKEKLGGLRFYINMQDVHTALRIQANRLISEAEKASYDICEVCGSKGELINWYFAKKVRCSICINL